MTEPILLPIKAATPMQTSLVNLSQMAADLRILIQAGNKIEAARLSGQLSDWLVEIADNS